MKIREVVWAQMICALPAPGMMSVYELGPQGWVKPLDVPMVAVEIASSLSKSTFGGFGS